MPLHVHDFTDIVLLGYHVQCRLTSYNFGIEVHGPIKCNMFCYNVIIIRLRGSIDQDVGHGSGVSSKQRQNVHRSFNCQTDLILSVHI